MVNNWTAPNYAGLSALHHYHNLKPYPMKYQVKHAILIMQ